MTHTTYRTEFPEFPEMPEAAQLLTMGFHDESWHNDTCPCFISADNTLRVWIEHPEPAQREGGMNNDDRFIVERGDFNPETYDPGNFDADALRYNGVVWDEVLRIIAIETTLQRVIAMEDSLPVATENPAPTISEAVSPEWRAVSNPEVLAMRVTDGCGHDCMGLILQADALIHGLTDCDPHHIAAVRAAVARQCEVFYFG